MIYTKMFKVPTWIVINEVQGKRRPQAVEKLLVDAGGVVKKWPAHSFKETILNFKNKGYASYFKEMPFVLETDLLLRAIGEHVKKEFGPKSSLTGAFSSPPHYIDRKVNNENDYEILFNSILALEDDMGLSHMFQIAENCHSESNKNPQKVWISHGPIPKVLLTRLANKVITIGDASNNDIVLEGKKGQPEIEEALSQYFTGV